MKNLIIALFALTIFACKKHCDIQYLDIMNAPLPKSVCIYSADSATQQIVLINASCDNMNIRNWTLGNNSNQEAYKFGSEKIEPGKHKTFSNFNFQIGTSGETIYLKDNKGRLVHTWHN